MLLVARRTEGVGCAQPRLEDAASVRIEEGAADAKAPQRAALGLVDGLLPYRTRRELTDLGRQILKAARLHGLTIGPGGRLTAPRAS